MKRLDIALTSTAKSQHDAAKSQLDGIHYEVAVREEGNGRFRGMVKCIACAITQPTAKLKQTADEAVALAEQELVQHHEEVHRTTPL